MQQFVWHLTHVDNIPSIAKYGLLCKVMAEKIQYTDIAESGIQARRAVKLINGQSLHNYVPTFWIQKTPMAYRQSHSNLREQLVWLKIDVHQLNGHTITADGNAVMSRTKFYHGLRPDMLDWGVLNANTWFQVHDGSRLRSAELLIHKQVPVSAIVALEVCCNASLAQCQIWMRKPASINRAAFFYSAYQAPIKF